MNFLAGGIAIAGVAAALGPVIIHLLNRQRYKVVQWAAMDFLREAMRRNRKILRLRDIVLLLLRTACLLLFGLALARPHFSSNSSQGGAGQPVHAVFILDNSLSMGYRPFEATLLDEAKVKAREFLERLPQGSRMTVLPLCGSANAFSRDAYRTVQDALDALARIEVVDRTATVAQAADLAAEACKTVPDLPAKRVIFLGDQQRVNWPTGALENRDEALPELQVVQVADERPENAWVSELRVQDGIADIETPATILATIQYDGTNPRGNVQATLTVDNAPVATRLVDLEPGQAREIQFTHLFDLPVDAGQAAFVPVSVTLSADKLPQDDLRALAVPVVAALPVVFIDQYGANENPTANQYGETFPLRRLLAPVTRREDVNRQVVQVRHVSRDELTQETLHDARLVVMAGVSQPAELVPLLRDFVRQGGQLVIAAGADFDPAEWSKDGWLDGDGILPAPLKSRPVGQLPEEATGQLQPFQLAPQSMVAEEFFVDQSSRQELEDLYRGPLFFKAVAAEVDDAMLKKLLDADLRRIAADRKAYDEIETQRKAISAKQAQGTLSAEEQARQQTAEQELSEKSRNWLRWQAPVSDAERRMSPEQRAKLAQPRVLASYSNGLPFLVERRVGRGSVLLCTSGVQSNWNTLSRSNAILLFDQLLRARLARTLPVRSIGTPAEFVLPVDPANRRAEFTLERPGGLKETLSVDALGADHYGLTLKNLTQRGHYRITASAATTDGQPGEPLWDVLLAANGPAQESELQPITAVQLSERAGQQANLRWIAAGQPISLDGTEVAGLNLWAWLLGAVLLLLFAEMALVSIGPWRVDDAVIAPATG